MSEVVSIPTDGPGLDMSEVFAPFYWGELLSVSASRNTDVLFDLGFVISTL